MLFNPPTGYVYFEMNRIWLHCYLIFTNEYPANNLSPEFSSMNGQLWKYSWQDTSTPNQQFVHPVKRESGSKAIVTASGEKHATNETIRVN